MPRKYWLPKAKPAQLLVVQNFRVKLEAYAVQLGLSPAEVTEALAMCDAIVGAINIAEQCKQSMLALTQWRDDVLSGEPLGSAAPPAPVFPVVGATTYERGVLKQFAKLRDQIVSSPGYTQAIGEDLGIIGPESTRPAPGSITPDLKAETSTGYRVNLTGSMQGMDALRVEYSRDGGENFQTVAFLTATPGGFQIAPANPNQPEKGVIRAVYIKRNEEIGNFSASYPVTVS